MYICSPHRGIEQQVARRAHNPKVTGSSPVPATNDKVTYLNGLVLPNRFFMFNFNTLIQNEYQNAYENAYDLSLKKELSVPYQVYCYVGF